MNHDEEGAPQRSVDNYRDRAEWAEAKLMLALDACAAAERHGHTVLSLATLREIIGVELMVDRVEIDD